MNYLRNWSALPVLQLRMILLLAGAVILANVRQPYPAIAPLQHIPTVVLIVIAPWLLRRWPFSNCAVGCVIGFLLLHTLAGRYTYSNVPYDAWARALFGVSIDRTFGLARNNFDRLVHLSFGLCAILPFSEAAHRYGKMSWPAALFMALLFVGAISALYEVFEWALTLVLAPGMADDYNGQQGDMWDSQKDMAIAMLGGALVSCWMVARTARAAKSAEG